MRKYLGFLLIPLVIVGCNRADSGATRDSEPASVVESKPGDGKPLSDPRGAAEHDQAGIESQPGDGKPLSELPDHVTAAAGQLTLFADFEHKLDNRIPVYVVNRTGKAIKFFSQDGDTFMKLEYEVEPGKWARAQAHGYSWCGNSYGSRVLGHNAFLLVNGYLPADGFHATVRYSFYRQNVKATSNHGEGLANPQDIMRAANDALAVDSGDFAFVRKVALGELQLKNQMDHSDPRGRAIGRLGEGVFDPGEAKKVLRRVVESGEEFYSKTAADVLAGLERDLSK